MFRGRLKSCAVRTDAQAGERGESSRRKELFFTETECFLREDHGLSPRRGRAALVKGKGALRHEEGQALRYFARCVCGRGPFCRGRRPVFSVATARCLREEKSASSRRKHSVSVKGKRRFPGEVGGYWGSEPLNSPSPHPTRSSPPLIRCGPCPPFCRRSVGPVAALQSAAW